MAEVFVRTQDFKSENLMHVERSQEKFLKALTPFNVHEILGFEFLPRMASASL